MRYREKVRLLSAAAAALALAATAGLFFSPEARAARAFGQGILAQDAPEVESLEVLDQGGALVFSRFGGSWILEEDGRAWPARAERIGAYLDVVRAVRNRTLVSRSDASWAALGLDEGTARRVRLLDKGGQAAADFRVGRYSPDGSHVHVRMEGDPRGYSVPAPVSTRLPETRRSWLDLRIFGESVPMEDIQGLRVSGLLRLSDGRVFSARYSILPTQGRAWQSEEVPDLDPAAAVRLVRTWMHAEAEDFSREGPAGRDGEGLRVDLELAGGTLRSLWIQAEPDSEGRHLAVMTGTGRYFRIAPWTMRELLKTPQDLATRVPDSRP